MLDQYLVLKNCCCSRVLKRKIITTADGSKTIQIEEWNEQYHSVHGAIQEANHVFLKHGLLFFIKNIKNSENKPESKVPIEILEIGFGTGLNAFLTLMEAEKQNVSINYVGVEGYPVLLEEIDQLNYIELISKSHHSKFQNMHTIPWEKPAVISRNFQLEKQERFFEDLSDSFIYDIIYFDAFGARVQPHLWTEAIFKIMFEALKPNGILVTYAAKGSVRRAMQAVGFEVERLPGPPGKREMLRAQKKCLS